MKGWVCPGTHQGTFRLVLLNASYHKKHDYIWFNLNGFWDIRTSRKVRAPAWLRVWDFKFQTFLQNLLSVFIISKKITTIPWVVSKQKSRQNLDGFGHARGPALESNILNFETLMHKFTSLSTLSLYFRTIRPVVTENSPSQNLGIKKKKEE